MTFYCNGNPIGRVEDVELEGVDISDLKVWKDETFTTEVDTSGWTADMWKDVFGLIPIIRCRDCKYWTADDEERTMYCGEEILPTVLACTGNGYCSFAERKEK